MRARDRGNPGARAVPRNWALWTRMVTPVMLIKPSHVLRCWNICKIQPMINYSSRKVHLLMGKAINIAHIISHVKKYSYYWRGKHKFIGDWRNPTLLNKYEGRSKEG